MKTKRPATVRRSNRDTVQWVPVTEASFARAVLAAEMDEVDLAVWLEGAIKLHLERTRASYRDRLYQEACDLAAERMEGEPTRWEFDRKFKQSFVRRPAGEAENQGGRPSSRPPQNGTAAQGRSQSAEGGTGATRSFSP